MRTAAQLARDVLDLLSAKRPLELAARFAEDGIWELAYPLAGMSDAQRVVSGRRRITRFHEAIDATVASAWFSDVRVSEVSDELAFAEFASEVVTAKGERYGNRYVARVEAGSGEITRWLEFFDPRPAELIRRDFAERVARR